MPKKKDKKSLDKQDEDRKTAKMDIIVDKPPSDDKEKDLYLIQIRYLNEQLDRYQLKCDQLQRQNLDVTTRCSSLEKEKRDVVEFLKRSLLQREEELEELTERMEGQRQAADRDREAGKLQHSQLRQELQDRIKGLTAENRTLASRLDSLAEFQKQKQQLTSTMESLEKHLVDQTDQHKAAVHNLEMKALVENKRLEQEMESHVAAMSAEVESLVEQRVPEVTRCALQENTEVKALCDRLTEQTEGLMQENTALRDSKGRLTVDRDNLEAMLKETARQSCIRKKVVEQLTVKCECLQAELKDRKEELEKLQTEHTGTLDERDTLRQERASLSDQSDRNRSELSGLETELQEERKRRSRMKSIMQEAAIPLRQALREAPTEPDCDPDCVVQWKQLMQKLLLLLDRHTPTKSSTERDQLTNDPAAVTAESLNPALSFQFELARYRPGDLGLVPRPNPKHKHIISGTRPGASSTNLPLYRKPTSQKAARSINPTNSVVRFLSSRKTFSKTK